jgi:urease accessory protein
MRPESISTLASLVPGTPPTTSPRSDALGALPLLKLLQLTSPGLPIGAFAYSQALEQAIALGWVKNEVSAQDWICGLLAGSIGKLDLPVLARVHGAFACGDDDRARTWSEFLLASRASAELQAEDRSLGSSLARVLDGLAIDGARTWLGSSSASYAALFALAAVRWNIPVAQAATGYAFAWLEAQVAAATRLCPLGQQAAQRILSRALPSIPEVVSAALALADDDIGAAAPAQAVASALHETLYSRLCRS